jgi:hypothetical protein
VLSGCFREDRMRKIFLCLGVLLCAQQISGCGWLIRAIEGTETLEDKPVTGLRLTAADSSNQVCAGAPIQLKVTADIQGKEPMTTWSYDPQGKPVKKGHLVFEDFDFSSNFGQVSPKDGMLVVPNTGLELLGQQVKIDVSSKHAAGHTGEMSLGLHFGCGVVLNYNGASGQPGATGLAGQAGRDGKSDQSSGSYARPGGHGEDGLRGGDGGRGGPAGHGHDLTVDVAKILSPEKTELVLVRVTDHSQANLTRTALIDPAQGGQVVIKANGGQGGQGGGGGFGGRGGRGGTGSPAGNGGNGSDGGNGGDGGDGGNGGRVILRYDSKHADLIDLVEIQNRAGAAGGSGGGGGSGSGGTTYSGGRQGRSGRVGTAGHAGRPGSDGPVSEPQAVPLEQIFPDLGGLKFI